jgi:hypothetical protein
VLQKSLLNWEVASLVRMLKDEKNPREAP